MLLARVLVLVDHAACDVLEAWNPNAKVSRPPTLLYSRISAVSRPLTLSFATTRLGVRRHLVAGAPREARAEQ